MTPYQKLQQALAGEAWQVPCQNAPDFFFPPLDQQRVNENYYKNAKTLCAGCPIQLQCLEYALDTKETEGVWGGTTPQERKRHHQKRPYGKLDLGLD